MTMTTPASTTLHFHTHVSDSGVITLPPLPETFCGEDVTVKVDMNNKSKRESLLDEIFGGWAGDERSTEEIIRDVYEARTIGKEGEPLSEPTTKRSFEELCGVWGNEEDRADIDRMVAAIHEGRLLKTKRESL